MKHRHRFDCTIEILGEEVEEEFGPEEAFERGEDLICMGVGCQFWWA